MKQPTICLVCCLHGDEVFGKRVFDFFQANADRYPSVKPIFANPRAYENRKRFVDTDLNRSFGQQTSSNGYEAGLVPNIFKHASQADFVIDIHTTVAEINSCSIITKLNKQIELLLSHIPAKEVALIEPTEVNGSLIGNVNAGVSIEFNEIIAQKPETLETVVHIIDGVLSTPQGQHVEKELFYVNGTISRDATLPADSANFRLVPSRGIYPILFSGHGYEEHRGFSARDKIKLDLDSQKA